MPEKSILPLVTMTNDIAKGRKVPMSPKDPEISDMIVETFFFLNIFPLLNQGILSNGTIV